MRYAMVLDSKQEKAWKAWGKRLLNENQKKTKIKKEYVCKKERILELISSDLKKEKK